MQGGEVAAIPRDVSVDFFRPEFRAGFWNAEIPAAIVPVPEATVDKDEDVVLWQDDVRAAGKLAVFGPLTVKR